MDKGFEDWARTFIVQGKSFTSIYKQALVEGKSFRRQNFLNVLREVSLKSGRGEFIARRPVTRKTKHIKNVAMNYAPTGFYSNKRYHVLFDVTFKKEGLKGETILSTKKWQFMSSKPKTKKEWIASLKRFIRKQGIEQKYNMKLDKVKAITFLKYKVYVKRRRRKK